MGQHLFSIRILFHASFAFVYLPIIVLGFTWGLSKGNSDVSFVQNHFFGITALSALVGLGIFAALDILTIRRTVNQRAFLIIEIIVVILMPLSMWPFVISSISVVWSNWFTVFVRTSCYSDSIGIILPVSWLCTTISLASAAQTSGDEVTPAYVVAATVAILALNTVFLSYICITAVTDKVRGSNFLPIYPGDPSLSSLGMRETWYLWGNRRTNTERKAMTSHCADYIFRNTIFRKHAFEPTIWAIFRGIIAIYACVSLVVFSAYSALSEAQLRRALAVHETIIILQERNLLANTRGLSVASFIIAPRDLVHGVNREKYPPPTFSGDPIISDGSPEIDWQNTMPGSWTNKYPANFNISWAGEYSLVTWVISSMMLDNDNDRPLGKWPMYSTQVNSTNSLTLAPFKKHSISLIGILYILPDCAFTQWIPDTITSVDNEPGSNTAMATFTLNGLQQQILQRDARPPSMFLSVAHVISDIGGMLSFIDGLFALVFGRTIVAILFGTRIVSPFGLLGMVTHNRFKRLIHEQYPRMQEDIEHGGMAAYISEVAIDAALIDKPSPKGHTRSTESSFMGDGTGEGHSVGLRHMQAGSGASYLRLPYTVEELGDLESSRCVARQTDNK